MKKPNKQIGFTIVELLIVIVVIAVLAAITIVAFNGIQDRARMSAAFSFEQQLRHKYLADATGDWNFDDCSGSTVKNNGTIPSTDSISGTATWITSTPTGKGCALTFNGSTQIQTTATLGTTYYVKGAWVRISAASCNSYNIISQAATNGAQAAMYVPGGCIPNAGHNGAWGTVYGSQAINDGKWHYVATIWENGTLTLYVDGKSVKSATAATPNTATGYVAIGSHGGSSFMVGDIDNPFVASQ